MKSFRLEFDSSEVGWWKLHDELEFVADKTPLAKAFASLYAAEFGQKLGDLMKAGQLRAEATREHDLAEVSGIAAEEAERHWDKAGELLVDFYIELKSTVAREV